MVGLSSLLAERARSECARSMRAVKAGSTTLPGAKVRNKRGETRRVSLWEELESNKE
jgi:hypothetical protein